MRGTETAAKIDEMGCKMYDVGCTLRMRIGHGAGREYLAMKKPAASRSMGVSGYRGNSTKAHKAG